MKKNSIEYKNESELKRFKINGIIYRIAPLTQNIFLNSGNITSLFH
jgi:hypothetical protein